MILSNFKDFPRIGRIIGVDWGRRRCGIAVTDPDQEFSFARPPIVAPDQSFDMPRAVAGMALSEQVVAIVVGLPLRMDGSESETTGDVRDFVGRLEMITDLPIFLIDETLSSRAAQDNMGRVRRRDIKEKLDSNAARVILENAISVARRMA